MTTAKALACPKCGSANTVPIVFGLPTPETERRKERGEVYTGGCIIPPPERWADHACKDCNHEWAEESYPWDTSAKARKPSRRRR